MSQIERARKIAATLGTFRAARYLRGRGWSIEGAIQVLTVPDTKRTMLGQGKKGSNKHGY
jgi:hypothetical protein